MMISITGFSSLLFSCANPMPLKQWKPESHGSDLDLTTTSSDAKHVFDHWQMIHETQPKTLITDTREMTSPKGIMGCCAPLDVCTLLRCCTCYLPLMHAITVCTCVPIVNHLYPSLYPQSLLSLTNIYSPNCTATPPPHVNRVLSSPGKETLFVLLLQEVLGSVCLFDR